MILTITPNPLLEKRLLFNEIIPGGVNRCKKEILYAGGKGINVNRQLNRLGVKNSALTFLGGHNGKLLRKTLEDSSINFNAVNTKSETRYASVIIEETAKNLTSYFSPNSDISENEVDEFIFKMDKAIQNCSIVVFAGSSPNKAASKIFSEGIKLANEYDKIAVLDTYGDHLKECLELAPFAIHNNRREIEQSLHLNLNSEDDIYSFLDSVYENGTKMSFITDGANPVYSSKFDFHYKTAPPKVNVINSLGSGDAFVAGIVYGLDRSLIYDDFLSLSVALGSINAEQFDAANVIIEDAEKLTKNIQVEAVGKKMKLIDDSPNY